MSDTQQNDATEQQPEGDETQQEQEQTFTQADVDKIIADRLKRERETVKAKFADYDELKKEAGKAKTAEDRLADLEKRYADAESRALRANVASEYGISAEDRDLFLTGEDEETLTAQAKRLSERDSERKKRKNHVPNEGNNPRPSETEEREVTRRLFGRD